MDPAVIFMLSGALAFAQTALWAIIVYRYPPGHNRFEDELKLEKERNKGHHEDP